MEQQDMLLCDVPEITRNQLGGVRRLTTKHHKI